MIKISSVRCAFPENEGFRIDRRHGHTEYTFLHFHNSVDIAVGGKTFTTAPHALVIFSPDEPYYFKSHTPLVHDWFHFDGQIQDCFSEAFCPNQIYYPTDYNFITETVAELESEFFGNRQNCHLLLDLKIKELFLKLQRDITEKQTAIITTQTEQQFRILRGEIFASLSSDWSVKKMADRVNLSESRFFALYKQVFGISPTADLINAKINSAKNMLRFQDSKIEDISIELGYENKTHFIRQFKKLVGTTPSGYRARHTREKH